MPAIKVDDINVDSLDFTGSRIIEVFGKISGRYAVYQTEQKISVQFADDDAEGINQRAALAPLLPLRGEIEVLLTKLAADHSDFQRAKFKEYSSNLAKGLLAALQGQAAMAQDMLTNTRDDMVEDQASDIRTRHLIYASCTTLLTIIISAVFAGSWFIDQFAGIDPKRWPTYWYSAIFGSIGALFSIALQFRDRKVRIAAQSWDNISDAILRILIGATSAVIVWGIFRGGFLDIQISNHSISDSAAGMMVLSFSAGFTERLASEFLAQMGLTGKAEQATTAAANQANERSITSPPVQEQAPRGTPVAAQAPPVLRSTKPGETNEDQFEPDADQSG